MTEKLVISYKEQLRLQNDIIRQITKDHFLPGVIIGVSRGGLPIGVMLSHYYDTPFIPFKGSLRDHPNWETDWKLPSHWQLMWHKNIIIVDDICEEGNTFKKIYNDISKAYPKVKIKTCALVQNVNKVFTVDYYGITINKKENPCWVVFPFEDWWRD
jgi:hypoxanthine phosphoribosyltransferase